MMGETTNLNWLYSRISEPSTNYVHPGRLTWKHTNHPFRKENYLPNPYDYVPCLIFQGVSSDKIWDGSGTAYRRAPLPTVLRWTCWAWPGIVSTRWRWVDGRIHGIFTYIYHKNQPPMGVDFFRFVLKIQTCWNWIVEFLLAFFFAMSTLLPCKCVQTWCFWWPCEVYNPSMVAPTTTKSPYASWHFRCGNLWFGPGNRKRCFSTSWLHT